MYVYDKDLFKAKYQFLIKKTKSPGLKHFIHYKAFVEYSNDMDGIYKTNEEYHPNEKRKLLIVFDDMISDC